MQQRFFYHSFPRRAREQANATGLAILRSLTISGLLLTPERTSWSEFKQDGRQSAPIEVFQKRACFTELAPNELADHAKQFGPFAIEFEIENLRLLGAIPVFYLPMPGTEERALAGNAGALVARMAEIQQLLSRLADIDHRVAITPDKSEPIDVTVNGQRVGTRCTIGGAEDFVSILTYDSQPVQELLNAFRALSGFFYPTENLQYTGKLAYYRQREWRIISAMKHRNQEISRPLTPAEVDALLKIDEGWFQKRLRFPSGESRRVEQCRYISEVDGRPILSWARRVVVPDECVDTATELLFELAMPIPVVAASQVVQQPP